MLPTNVVYDALPKHELLGSAGSWVYRGFALCRLYSDYCPRDDIQKRRSSLYKIVRHASNKCRVICPTKTQTHKCRKLVEYKGVRVMSALLELGEILLWPTRHYNSGVSIKCRVRICFMNIDTDTDWTF
jgi:hypothetical protein